MIEVTIVVREVGRLVPARFLRFELPEIPAMGSYISVQCADDTEPFSIDLIVQKVWWRLHHPAADSTLPSDKIGDLREILVECDPALGPYSSEEWRKALENNPEVETFEAARSTPA